MVQDLRYAWRMLRKSPGFAAVVILTLALSIGANTAVFSVVRGVLLKPLPYRDPARLVDIVDGTLKDASVVHAFGTYSDFEEYAGHARSFEKIAFGTFVGVPLTLTGRGPARNIAGELVSQDFFDVPGVAAARGRTFETADLNRGCSVVVSDRLWSSVLASDPGAVGKSLELNHRACTVLGVMPAGFEFYPRDMLLWMLFTADDTRPHDSFYGFSFARLGPNVTVAQAQAEIAALHRHMSLLGAHRDYAPIVSNLQDDFTYIAGKNLRATLILLLVAVALVLLIACLNVANLLLSRWSARAREMAVRAALGSGRGRLVRQLLVEGLLLSAIGGLGGVAIAVAMVKYFVYANPIDLPIGSDVSVNVPVLAFTALLTMATTLIFGMAPAWRGSRADVNAGLRAAGRGSIGGGNRRLTQVLIAVEISLALMLLAGAGLLMRSVLKFSGTPLGFDTSHVWLSYANLPERQFATGAEKLRFYDNLRDRLNSVAGVEGSAIAVSVAPYGFGIAQVEIGGQDGGREVGDNRVSPDYFRVLRVALRRGRGIERGDGAVAVVNEKFASEYFKGADPLGKRVRLTAPPGPWLTIVGVVGTEKEPDYQHEMGWLERAMVYRPIEQEPSAFLFMAVRTRGERRDVAAAIASAVGGVDREVATTEVFTLRDVMGRSLRYPRFRAIVLDQFAALALLLAALGLHGLLSQWVAQRTQELGLRMAIGARTGDILRLVAIQGGTPLLAGLGIGMIATVAMTGSLSNLLFEVSPGDPLTMVAAPVVLLMAALAAMVRPALTAATVDPIKALRDE